jgi:hypothetical protein
MPFPDAAPASACTAFWFTRSKQMLAPHQGMECTSPPAAKYVVTPVGRPWSPCSAVMVLSVLHARAVHSTHLSLWQPIMAETVLMIVLCLNWTDACAKNRCRCPIPDLCVWQDLVYGFATPVLPVHDVSGQGGGV